jgi:hypothetical protein
MFLQSHEKFAKYFAGCNYVFLQHLHYVLLTDLLGPPIENRNI